MSTLIVDNSENAYILLEEGMFTDKIYINILNGVENIGGKVIITKWIGTVGWSCTDEVQLNVKKLNNWLYFPNSAVNILSETASAKSIKYYEVTMVLTKSKYSIFT